MTIKYANIIINRDLENESWINYFKRLFGEENIVDENDTIIITFEDGTICDVKNEYIDKQFEMGPQEVQSIFPAYFNKKDGEKLLFKRPHVKEGNLTIDLKSIFKDSLEYVTLNKVPSIFNIIYKSIKTDIDMFAIVKNGTNELSPRYFIAYDDVYFERSDIIYLINYIFNNSK